DLRRHRPGEGIGRSLGPVPTVVAAPHIHHPLPIGREGDRSQLLTVVLVIPSELAGPEFGTFGDPEVSQAALIEGPGQALPGRGGGQLVREWETLHLIERETPRGGR